MTKRIYLMKFTAQTAMRDVPELLRSLGALVHDPCWVRGNAVQPIIDDSELVVITLHDGDDFGSRHTCVSRSLEHAKKRGFHVSDSFSAVVSLQTIPVLTILALSAGSEDLRAEVEAFQRSDNCLSLMKALPREVQTEYALS